MLTTLKKYGTIGIASLAMLPTNPAFAQLIRPEDRPRDVPNAVNIRQVVINIINFALSFVGLIAVAFIIYAGFLYLTSGGDEANTKKAKTIIGHAIIGIIIILLSWALVNFVIRFATAIEGNPLD